MKGRVFPCRGEGPIHYGSFAHRLRWWLYGGGAHPHPAAAEAAANTRGKR